MKMHFVSVLDGIDNLGFRKFTAFLRSYAPEALVSFIVPGNYRSPLNRILAGGEVSLSPEEIEEIATILSRADLVGFSSMTGYAFLVKEIIKGIRKKSPKTYIVWGGIHAIVDPEDAIEFADAVCTGEGEFAFKHLHELLSADRDPTSTPSFWFKHGRGVVRNKNLPLMTHDEMSSLPFLTYQDGETIYEKGKGFIPMERRHFARHNGINYSTIWSVGCPLRCAYCSNSKFIDYDPNYRRIRHPSVEYIISEILRAKSKHPFITGVTFNDDSFMAIPYDTLQEFAAKYKQQVGLPFVVVGVIPNYVKEEKVRLLAEAGMIKVRMGIQSGSQRILDLYKRHTPIEKIKAATLALNRYSKRGIPPTYDIILDNPMETREDTVATIDLLYDLPRPYTCNLFSLRIIPNTELAKTCLENGVSIDQISSSYRKHANTFGNCLIYAVLIWKMPKWVFGVLKRHVKPSIESGNNWRYLTILLRAVYLFKRACYHLRAWDFAPLPGWFGYLFWKAGLKS